ncbi:hypothetical protein TNCV_2727621 [Trichonephila clavipes]|nr:hypothetical protein TNCV_2727621 [Trichonephila clavipes]
MHFSKNSPVFAPDLRYFGMPESGTLPYPRHVRLVKGRCKRNPASTKCRETMEDTTERGGGSKEAVVLYVVANDTIGAVHSCRTIIRYFLAFVRLGFTEQSFR